MNLEQQTILRQRVEAEIKEVERTIASLKESSKAVAPDNSLGRLTRMEVMSDQQISLAKLSQAQQRRSNLSDVLRNLALPDFGVCRICRKTMDPDRILAAPEAVACAPCLNRLQARGKATR